MEQGEHLGKDDTRQKEQMHLLMKLSVCLCVRGGVVTREMAQQWRVYNHIILPEDQSSTATSHSSQAPGPPVLASSGISLYMVHLQTSR